MNQPRITPTGKVITVRTINDTTPREAAQVLQEPTGEVICPHCHQPVGVDAKGIHNVISGNFHDYVAPDDRTKFCSVTQQGLCGHCSGYFNINVRDENLLITPITVPDKILEAEAVIAERQKWVRVI